MTALQLLGMEWRPRALPEGPAKRDRAAAGTPDPAHGTPGHPHPTSGSHLPPEGTALPCVVAFRIVAPCPVTPKKHTPSLPNRRFGIIPASCSPHRRPVS